MSIGFWNIRGGARKNALEELRDFCISKNIKILMLCEAKSQSPPPKQPPVLLASSSLILSALYGMEGAYVFFGRIVT